MVLLLVYMIEIRKEQNTKVLKKSDLSFFFLMEIHQTLGKIGKVTRVYDDGDLRVIVDGQTWTWNPLCLTPLPGSATELHNTMAASIQQEHTSMTSFYFLFTFH